MTLEGTIVYADKQAEWMSKYSDVGEYESRSEYYRQLAEWLRELKKYKESDTIFEAFQTVGIMIRAKVNELCNDGKFIEAEEIRHGDIELVCPDIRRRQYPHHRPEGDFPHEPVRTAAEGRTATADAV